MKCRIFVILLAILCDWHILANALEVENPAIYGKMTISRALELAETSNMQLQKNALEQGILNHNLYNAYSEVLPQVNFISKKEDYKIRYDTPSYEDRDVTSDTRMLNIDQTISFHKIVPKLMRAHKERDAHGYNLLNGAQEARLKIVEAFINVYRNSAILPLINEIEKVAKQQMEVGKIKLQYDQISSYDFVSLTANIAQIAGDRIKTVNDLDIAKNTYKALLGVPAEELILDEKVAMPASDIENFLEMVVRSNPKLMSLKSSVSEAKYALTTKMVDILPDVKVGYSNNRYTKLWYLAGYPNLNQNIFRIELSVPIFDGGKRISDIGKATKQLKIAGLNSEIAYEDIIRDASNAWSEYEIYSKMIEQYTYSLRAMEDIYEQKQVEYNKKHGSLYSILTAKRNMLDIKIKLITARCNRMYAYYKMLGYLG